MAQRTPPRVPSRLCLSLRVSTSKKLSRHFGFLMVVLTLGWGMNWPMIKLGVAEIPVWTFRSACVIFGALGLFAIARVSGDDWRIKRAYWLPIAGMALCNVTLWNIFVTYGVKMLPAGRSAIIAYTMPLWAAILSVIVLKETLTPRRVLGILIGMVGLGLLLAQEFTAIQAAPLGAMLIIVASISWSIGITITKKYALPIPTTTLTAWNLFLGGIPIAIGAFVLERHDIHPIGAGATIGLLYNIIVAFIICHWVFFRLVSIAPVSLMSIATLMIPVVAVSSGMIVLGERPRVTDYAALALIVAALATVLLPTRTPSRA